MLASRIFPRIGLPQLAALTLLLILLGQCLWFMAHVPITQMESSYIEDGLLHVDRLLNAGTEYYSPLIPLLAGIPARLIDSEGNFIHLSQYRFLIRLPFLIAGLLLGASLWYVARRLYGNFGGYIALGLYCFSPMVVTRSSQVQPDIIGAWGAFGLIFTAIAAAHTLYAPRDVVFWNGKRILLMGISIALCVGSQWSLWIMLLPALAFMLWVGHVRPAAALLIFAIACGVAFILLWGIASFRPAIFAEALRSAHWIEFSPAQVSAKSVLTLLGLFFLQNGLGTLILLVLSLVTFAAWKRARYFGNAAPLITATLLFVAALAMQHFAGLLFLFVALPFFMLFMAGVSADLLETKYAVFANAIIVGALIANAVLDVGGLLQLARPITH
ncbi:MAG TPA: glycosyltransferase family 39 protein [Candidatus Methylomirabilis sp.]|nr:glycosyltransferase family 39 protein [Candidatus Methylomirabilis sp.]